jgi:hypothetical protein
MRVAQCLSFPKIPSAGFLVEDLASIVKPGIFIVDDVALPTPITFLVLPGEKAVAAKLAGGGLGLASGGPRVGRLSETGSDTDAVSLALSRKVDRAKVVLFPDS